MIKEIKELQKIQLDIAERFDDVSTRIEHFKLCGSDNLLAFSCYRWITGKIYNSASVTITTGDNATEKVYSELAKIGIERAK